MNRIRACAVSALWLGVALGSVSAEAGVLLPDKSPDKPLKVRKEQHLVRIFNQVMQTKVNQIFENQTGAAVEATYLFRPPAGAAVSGFATWVKGKKIESKVQEKHEAKATYDRARRSGGAPALLSQLTKGAFSMKVAEIGAGMTRRVELRYEGILDYRAGTVSLHLPLTDDKVKQKVVRGELEVAVEISDTKEITAVRSTTLPVRAERISPNRWRVSYRAGVARPDQDLRLQYDVRSKDIGLTFLTHRPGGKDGYFMLMAAPQELTTDADIVKKDVVYVFDVSGSMQGEKIQQARGALKSCLGFMNPGDRFGIVAFSDNTNPFRATLESVRSQSIREAEAFIDTLEPSGGTNIDLALREGLKLLGPSPRPKVIVFLTDGQPTTGVTDTEGILAAVNGANRSAGRIFTFGVGADVNRPFLERLGRGNRGAVDFIAQGANLKQAVAAFYNKISRPVLSDLVLDFKTVTVAMTYPNVLPDMYKGSQLLLVGRYRGERQVEAALSGRLNGKQKVYRFRASFPAESDDNAFLPRLWASRRIDYLLAQMRMHGETTEGRSEVIRLAKAFHIATPFTSLVATAPRWRMASLSPARIKPGDPEIRIRAPRDARAVTVVFPFGLTKAARFEPAADLWTVRFLIPRDTPDGSYPVSILVTLADGTQRLFSVHYTVDTAAPAVRLVFSGPAAPGTTVTLTATQVVTEQDLRQAPGYRGLRGRSRRLYAKMMQDARQVQVRTPDGQLILLRQDRRGGPWIGTWTIPATWRPTGAQGAGSAELEVVAIDVAGNRSSTRQSIPTS